MRKGIRELHDWRTEVILFFGVFAGTTWVQKPSRFSFFGDSWDVLYSFLLDPRTIWQPHNEHFIPLFKIFYFLQYRLFGANHLGYMLVLYLVHSLCAVFVYRIGRAMRLSYWSSIAAALIFSFNSVFWEVIGWSFEQSFALGVVFSLATLDTFLRGAPGKGSLAYTSGMAKILIASPTCLRSRVARAHLRHTGHQTAERKRPRGCESAA